MAVRTSGVGTERKLEFWDQYGVERYRFLPTEMLTPGPEYEVPPEAVTEPITFEFEKLLLTDTDATPEGAVLLKVLDKKLKLRNADDDADVILDEVFIPHTFTNLVKFARPANEPSVRIGDAGQGYQILQFSKRTAGGGIANLGVEDEASYLLLSAGVAPAAWSPSIGLFGIDEGSGNAGCISVRSAKSIAGGTDYNIERLKFGIGAIAEATWSAVLQKGLKLKDALDANSQKITSLAAATADGDALSQGKVPIGAAGALTIATGAIAVTKSFHKVDTEAGGATDDLDSITGGAEGDVLVLKAADGTHTVVCKHGTGNLRLDGSADFSLDNADDSITLIFDGTNWLELARSNNGA